MSPEAIAPSSGEPGGDAEAQRIAGDAAAGVDRRCRRKPRRGCARRARRSPASTLPRDRQRRDRRGAQRRAPGRTRPRPRRRFVAGVRGRGAGHAALRAAGRDRADDAGPRAIGELEREAGAVALPTGSATTAAPLAGQRHDQPLFAAHARRLRAASACRRRPRWRRRSRRRRRAGSGRETRRAAGSALGRQSSPIGTLSLRRASAHSRPGLGGFERLGRAVLVGRRARLDDRVAVGDRDDDQHREHEQHRDDQRGGAALAAKGSRSVGGFAFQASQLPTTEPLRRRAPARTLRRTLGSATARASIATAKLRTCWRGGQVVLPTAQGSVAEALEARLLGARLDLERGDGERRRIGERLPVAVAELQLDRAVAQAKAEALVAVDAAVLVDVAREAEPNRVRSSRLRGDERVGIGEHRAAVVAAHARGRGTPVAGAAQVASDDVGGGAQVLHQARFDRQRAVLARMVRDDCGAGGDDRPVRPRCRRAARRSTGRARNDACRITGSSTCG